MKKEKHDRPESPQFKQVIGYMLEMAKNLGHEHIGTEHLLLGLLRDREGIAVQALQALGVDVDRLEVEASRRLPAGSPESIAAKEALGERFADHPEVRGFTQRIAQLQRDLEQAVAARDFAKAAACRDERVAVWQQLQQLLATLAQEP